MPKHSRWMVHLGQAIHKAVAWPRNEWETAVLTAILVFARSPN